MFEILIFIVILALAIKSLITFLDWVKKRIKKAFNKKYNILSEKQELEKHLAQDRQLIQSLQKKQQTTDDMLNNLSQKIDILIQSDRDDIRSYITREHHYFCYQKGWIDDFSLDCIEKQYMHYVDEGGNSFIEGFMHELRALPKQPPNT